MKIQHYYDNIFAKDASSKSNQEEALDKPKLRESLQCNWPIVFKRIIIMKVNKSLKNSSRSKETSERMATKCN